MEELKEWLKQKLKHLAFLWNYSMEELKEWLKHVDSLESRILDYSMEELKEWLKRPICFAAPNTILPHRL